MASVMEHRPEASPMQHALRVWGNALIRDSSTFASDSHQSMTPTTA